MDTPRSPEGARPFSAGRFSDEDFFVDDDAAALAELASHIRAEARAQASERATFAVPASGAPTFSLEVFPARTAAKLRTNVASVRRMLSLGADFVTVTYGAAGSRQTGTKETVAWLAEAGVPTYAHLTCQAESLSQLDATIDELLDIGVAGILALRGDPRSDGLGLVLNHADDLVRRIRERAEAASRSVKIAVAAFPTGHPESANLAEDAQTVARKADAGADFAITQHFFHARDYADFLALVAQAGSQLPIVPGLSPITSARRLYRMCELAATPPPADFAAKLESVEGDVEAARSVAVEATVALARELAEAGAPGIQLFTMNDETTAAQIFTEIAPVFGK